MSKLDWSELKRLAENFPDYEWDSNQTEFFNGPSGESLGGDPTGYYCVYGPAFEIEDESYDGPTLIEACPLDQAKFICEAKAAVLAFIAENERLNACLQWEQYRAERIGTHGPGCESWEPGHYECLLRERDEMRKDAERYRWLRSPAAWNGFQLVMEKGGDNLDVAIDASMNQEGRDA